MDIGARHMNGAVQKQQRRVRRRLTKLSYAYSRIGNLALTAHHGNQLVGYASAANQGNTISDQASNVNHVQEGTTQTFRVQQSARHAERACTQSMKGNPYVVNAILVSTLFWPLQTTLVVFDVHMELFVTERVI